jgi:hypothetical protein
VPARHVPSAKPQAALLHTPSLTPPPHPPRQGGRQKTVLKQQGQTQPDGACWSPDGKRLAVVLIERKKDAKISPENESHRLEIMAADGKNRRELKLADGNNSKVWRLGLPDWR